MMPSTIVQTNLVALLPRLQRFAQTLCGSATTADDLVQAACMKALDNAETWTPGTRFDAWMFRILRNQWTDWLRRRQTEGQVDPIDEVAGLIGDNGEARAEASLMLGQVWQKVEGLPAEQKQVLLLVCIEEMSYREVADVLDLPIGTVMSRLARARNRLIHLTETEPMPLEEQK
jgi:RNA polymerase sigma-70 factor (ECF subfamily)